MAEYGALGIRDRAFESDPDDEPVVVADYDLYGLDNNSPNMHQLDRVAEITIVGIGGVALVATELDIVVDEDDPEAIRKAERAVAERYGRSADV